MNLLQVGPPLPPYLPPQSEYPPPISHGIYRSVSLGPPVSLSASPTRQYMFMAPWTPEAGLPSIFFFWHLPALRIC